MASVYVPVVVTTKEMLPVGVLVLTMGWVIGMVAARSLKTVARAQGGLLLKVGVTSPTHTHTLAPTMGLPCGLSKMVSYL